MTKKITAVVITYNPTINSLQKLIDNIRNQNIKLILVDNASSNKNDWIPSLIANEDLKIIELEDNMGIAFAQNEGILIATEQKSDYIIFFDQDSSIPDGFVRQLLDGSESAKQRGGKIAAVGAIFVDSRYGFYYPIIKLSPNGRRKKINPSHHKDLFEASLIISSGTLVSSKAIEEIGMMNTSFFIDYVDTEWCLRAINKGYKIYAVPAARMEHAIGDASIKILKWRVPVHSAFRRYYRIRNSFYLWKLPHVPKLLSMREIAFSLIHQFILIAFCRDRIGYLKSLWTGVRDGITTAPKINETKRIGRFI